MKKILISVAPVSAMEHPIDPKKIAADVIECEKAGAGMVHLHVRDSQGKLTPDLTVFKETVERIRGKSDIIIQASTGGVSKLTIQERCAPLYYDQVEATSLNVGSCNLGDSVYCNPSAEVQYCLGEIIKTNKVPEIEVFELGMIHTVTELRKQFTFHHPLWFSIVLGHSGAAPATVEALIAMRSFIPEGALWGITQAHRRDYRIFTAALGMGASTIRVGFEDSNYLDETTMVSSNVPLVARVAKIIEVIGCVPATPNEARNMLNIKKN